MYPAYVIICVNACHNARTLLTPSSVRQTALRSFWGRPGVNPLQPHPGTEAGTLITSKFSSRLLKLAL